MSIIIKKPYGGQSAIGSLGSGPGVEAVYIVDRFTGETVLYERNKRTTFNFTPTQIDNHNLIKLGAATAKIIGSVATLKKRKLEFINELVTVPVISKVNYDLTEPQLKMADGKTYFDASVWSSYITTLWTRGYYNPWPDSEVEWALLDAAAKQTWTTAQVTHLGEVLEPVFQNYKSGGLNVPVMESPGHILFTISWWHELFTINNNRIVGYGTSPNATNATTWAQYLAE